MEKLNVAQRLIFRKAQRMLLCTAICVRWKMQRKYKKSALVSATNTDRGGRTRSQIKWIPCYYTGFRSKKSRERSSKA